MPTARVSSDPAVLLGKPVIAGTRISVELRRGDFLTVTRRSAHADSSRICTVPTCKMSPARTGLG